MGSIPAPAALFCGQPLQAGRPPARQDRVDEVRRQSLWAHFGGEALVIVVYRHEFDAEVWPRFEQRVPGVAPAIVLGPPQHTDVDEMPIARQVAVPFDAGVRRQNNVTIMRGCQMIEEVRGAGRFPEEFVHLPWAAVTE